MAKVVKRPGKLRVDGTTAPDRWCLDAYVHGKRVVKRFDTRREAEGALAKLVTTGRTKAKPACDPAISLRDYVDTRFFPESREAQLAPLTLERYEGIYRNHLEPDLGHIKVRDLTRGDIADWIQRKRTGPCSVQGQRKGDGRVPTKPLGRGPARTCWRFCRASSPSPSTTTWWRPTSPWASTGSGGRRLAGQRSA
jgi:hypothetical protein